MYDPPAHVWALTIGGPTAIAVAACLALYGGAVRTGLSRQPAQSRRHGHRTSDLRSNDGPNLLRR
jgi:hypothetical protein